MPNLLRTFIAVKPDAAPLLRQTISNLKNALCNEQLKWIEPHNLHLTLKFLGDTRPAQIDVINKELEQIARAFSPFCFQLKGVGVFKSNGKPRVLFAKIEDGEMLHQLADEMNIRLEKLGFEVDSRPFKPHLTLARIKFIKERNHFYRAVEAYQNTPLQNSKINEITFYQSILNPSGPKYISLKKFLLTKTASTSKAAL
ncbi:2'-5' RNA ligase [Mariniphaga anaerophila]|uniref:RNA 2',3'-cyclic phosphodiesterase n=1 Tax=Mariniphaga anaerophila TaxID=1484053 RepID=A0A1M5DG78_9BACT|nr:RNA 2',3'-cyclic phosphodiesterase [Mariniphaga anaerophila]SHF65712.1 2'-5' RNA ligase [Mariniphaga anaerophila]